MAIPGNWISPRTGRALSVSQQRRYERAGITKSAYESGTVNLGAARGHRAETEERLRRKSGEYRSSPALRAARDRGIDDIVPNLKAFSKEQQEAMARAYLGAYFQQDKSLPKSLRGVDQRQAAKDYVDLKDFMSDPSNVNADGFQIIGERDWKAFRDEYKTRIGFILHGAGWNPNGD